MMERHARLEGYEVADAAHVDTVEIGVADLWCRTDDDHFLRMQAVENLDDAFAQGGTADNAVVDDHQVVGIGLEGSECDVVNVCCKVVPDTAFSDERTQFDVFRHHLFSPDAWGMVFHSLDESVVRHFGRVGDV